MSRLRKLFSGGLFAFALTALIAWALSLPLLNGLNLEQESRVALLYALACAGLIHLYGRLPRRFRFLVPLLVLASLAGSIFLLKESAPSRLIAFVNSVVSGAPIPAAITLYLDALLPLMIVLLALYARLLMEGDPAFTLPLMVAPVLLMWFLGAREKSLVFLPAVLCLPLLYLYTKKTLDSPPVQAAPKTYALRGLALALALALLAFGLTPPKRTTLPKAEQLADDLRRRIEDMLLFTTTRSMFTLGSLGYQPMGESGLGGKPDISQVPLMTVNTDRRVYLRGTALDTYTGRAWYDSLSSQRYNWLSLRYGALREDLFNEDLPGNERASISRASVTLLEGLPTTLFVPQRLRSLSPGPNMTAYFNASSEVFITRDLVNGDSYSFSYEPYVAGEAATDALAARLAGAEPGIPVKVAPEYSRLPGHLQPDGIIAELAGEITRGIAGEYQKAAAIKRYLQRNYTYSLDVPPAPENQDFAAHFLFEQPSGYCTYFATAMTVLARSAGLQARYVEGFLADPQGQGSVTLTGMNAHAWTEIYFQGLGWVVFDATAPGDSQGSEDGENPPPPAPPSPSPNPEPSPSPEPSEQPSEQPQDQSATPTPPPEGAQDEPSPAPENTPEPEESPDESGPRSPFPWWWLLALALLALLGWRMREENPVRKENRLYRPQDKLALYWQALLQVNRAGKLPISGRETPLEYAEKLKEAQPLLPEVAAGHSAWLYGRQAPGPEVLTACRQQYTAAWKALPRHKQARLAIMRAVQGFPAFLREGWRKALKIIRNSEK